MGIQFGLHLVAAHRDTGEELGPTAGVSGHVSLPGSVPAPKRLQLRCATVIWRASVFGVFDGGTKYFQPRETKQKKRRTPLAQETVRARARARAEGAYMRCGGADVVTRWRQDGAFSGP